MRYYGFAPFYNENAEVLILGSFPSVKSREENFYYGNRQNRFWSVLAEAFGENVPTDIVAKKHLLLKHNIALWDVVGECEIKGSLDADIRDYKTADILSLIPKLPRLRKIILNGGTAAKIFTRSFPTLIPLSVALPSTSPANFKFDKTIWLDALQG